MLFSQTRTTGRFQIAARLTASWKAPGLPAPSPKKATATRPCFRCLLDIPAPTASGRLAPTIALAPSRPLRGSAMCIEPPLPWQMPSPRAKSSAIIESTSIPRARQWPLPRCGVATESSSARASPFPVAVELGDAGLEGPDQRHRGEELALGDGGGGRGERLCACAHCL